MVRQLKVGVFATSGSWSLCFQNCFGLKDGFNWWFCWTFHGFFDLWTKQWPHGHAQKTAQPAILMHFECGNCHVLFYNSQLWLKAQTTQKPVECHYQNTGCFVPQHTQRKRSKAVTVSTVHLNTLAHSAMVWDRERLPPSLLWTKWKVRQSHVDCKSIRKTREKCSTCDELLSFFLQKYITSFDNPPV